MWLVQENAQRRSSTKRHQANEQLVVYRHSIACMQEQMCKQASMRRLRASRRVLMLLAVGALAVVTYALPVSSEQQAASKPEQRGGDNSYAPEPDKQPGSERPQLPTLPDCADTRISVDQLQLAARADIVITGITLAAGPGAGYCDPNNGTLNVALDNSTDPQTNFIVLGVQCVHKGLLSCRNNPEDTKDCLVLVAAPTMKDAAPCSLLQGERYQFFLQKQSNGCAGYYLTMYEKIYHSVRRPLGGTGCTFYPYFPQANELQVSLAATCSQPAKCKQDLCSPLISKSPCANDTAVNCTLKTCPGKWMFHNAIMPEDTCYELYTYSTSGLPTNCYGRRYINNRIRQLAGKDGGLLRSMNTTANTTASSSTPSDSMGQDGAPTDSIGQERASAGGTKSSPTPSDNMGQARSPSGSNVGHVPEGTVMSQVADPSLETEDHPMDPTGPTTTTSESNTAMQDQAATAHGGDRGGVLPAVEAYPSMDAAAVGASSTNVTLLKSLVSQMSGPTHHGDNTQHPTQQQQSVQEEPVQRQQPVQQVRELPPVA